MKYKVVNFNDIDLNSTFFHFTNKTNLESIMINGLIPSIGSNAFGIEKNKKVFFSIGSKGVLKLFDVWIKWLINRLARNKYLNNAKTKEEWKIKLQKFNEDFLNMKIFEDREIKIQVFNYMYNLMKNSVYLVLDLKENEDFKYDDIDEAKAKSLEENTRTMLNILYGINESSSTNMEFWNMHTLKDKIIESNKIKILEFNGKIDVLSIIKEIQSIINLSKLKFPFLNEFLEYTNNLEKETKQKI